MSFNPDGRASPDSPPAAPAASAVRASQEIDARGIPSPLPLLRAHRALRGMAPGEVLKVVTSQEGAGAEFRAMVSHVSGYELVAQEDEGGQQVHLLRRRR